jgi:transcriptional regulator with XRE-family HTH domain
VTGITDGRRDLGDRLRALRDGARLKGYELAALAGWNASKVSRIENGNQIPSEDDIRVWCDITGATLHLSDLLATVRNVRAAYLEWQRIAATGLTRRQKQARATEESARLVRGFENELVPGLLQTREYARAVLEACIAFSEIPDDLDNAVAARMRRQCVLVEGVHEFHFLLAEQCLYRRVGDVAVMTGQLRALITITANPRIRLGIIPSTAQFRVPTTSFLLYDRRMAQVETATAELTVTQPRELRLYEKAFGLLTEQAVFDSAARQLITAAIDHNTADGRHPGAR